ncbi:MAG: hypothetical protein PHR96_00255 [Clostridia bacterium]|nr:hypothetical protein [Clostridia bacterium]
MTLLTGKNVRDIVRDCQTYDFNKSDDCLFVKSLFDIPYNVIKKKKL